MRRKYSIYLPEGLEYLTWQWCARCVDVVNRLETGRGAGMLELERALPLRRGPLVPWSSLRQLARTFLSSTFTISHCNQCRTRCR
jgi:hypothetical protein